MKVEKNNKKGFTLIELLAVIVILAIVSVIGATTILPYIGNSAKNAFAIEANHAIDAASQAMSLIHIGSITDDSVSLGNGNYCFPLEKLVEYGLWTKDAESVGAGKTYVGYVLVTKMTNSEAYTYKIVMHNDKFKVNKDGGNVSADNDTDIDNYVAPSSGSDVSTYSCS